MSFEGANGETSVGAAGFAKLETRKAMSPDAGFHICSINKVVTAVAVLRLAEQGKLSLNAKVVSILDSDVVRRVPHIADVTVRQLLDHSSGIYATNNDSAYVKTLVGAEAFSGRVWTPEELVARATLEENQLQAKPGEGHHYADTNYVLLGMIVERVTGEAYKAHVTRTIFAPLAMGSTYFYSDVVQGRRATPPHVADGYIKTSPELSEAVEMNSGFKSAGNGFLNTSIAAERIDAAAGVVTTLPELHKFAHALFRGSLLRPESRAWLLSVGEALTGVEPWHKKLRAMRGVNTEFGPVIFKEGDGPGGFNTLMAFHPQSGAIFVGFANQFGKFDEVDVMLRDIMGPLVTADGRR